MKKHAIDLLLFWRHYRGIVLWDCCFMFWNYLLQYPVFALKTHQSFEITLDYPLLETASAWNWTRRDPMILLICCIINNFQCSSVNKGLHKARSRTILRLFWLWRELTDDFVYCWRSYWNADVVLVPKMDTNSLSFRNWAGQCWDNVNFLTKSHFIYMWVKVFTVPIDSDVTILI